MANIGTPEAITGETQVGNEDTLANAERYLRTRDNKLNPLMLSRIGNELVKSQLAEYRFYGAWSLLESVYPGYFGLDDTRVGHSSDSVSRDLATALDTFDALARRTPYFTGGPTARSSELHDVQFGIKAQFVSNLRPIFDTTAKGLDTEKIINNFTNTNYMLRLQNKSLAEILHGDSPNLDTESRDRLGIFNSFVRGLEVESMLIGLGWVNYARNGRIVHVPSSPRHDYGKKFIHSPGFDVVAIDTATEQRVGISLKRSVILSRGRGDAPSDSERILTLYGDRDLNLSSDRLMNVDEFTGFDTALAIRVGYTIQQKLDKQAA